MIELFTPGNNAEISLQTAEQKAFLEQEEMRAAMDGALAFRWYSLEKEGIDCSFPLPVSFSWEGKDAESAENGAYYHLLLSEQENMREPQVYITRECRLDVYNLKVGTRYFWCVQKNGERSETASFETLLTLPRFLKIDAISNVRDMGGYRVAAGRIRQGLVYRGGEFELHMQLSPSGADELRRLGVRTDLDMRGEASAMAFPTSENLGMRRVFVPSVPYQLVFHEDQRAAMKKFFQTFADPENYPIYFHCWGGADRTGTAAFILGAFLGMRYEDLINDYEVTGLAIWGIRTRNYPDFQQFLKLFMALAGDTLREKGATYLKQYAGLTDGQLAEIERILVEKE